MRIGISQPCFLPWPGYFGLIDYVDEFILLADVQFEKRSWQQRNFIKFNDKKIILTVPVLKKKKYNQKIYEVKINKEDNYINKFIKTIEQSYRKSTYYNKYSKDIFDILISNDKSLMELNINFIKYFCDVLGIKTKITNSLELSLKNKKEDLIKEICKIKKCSEYITTIGAKEYLGDKVFFDRSSIKIKYFSIDNLFYNQIGGEFIEKLSIIDLIFNEGPNGLNIIKNKFLIL